MLWMLWELARIYTEETNSERIGKISSRNSRRSFPRSKSPRLLPSHSCVTPVTSAHMLFAKACYSNRRHHTYLGIPILLSLESPRGIKSEVPLRSSTGSFYILINPRWRFNGARSTHTYYYSTLIFNHQPYGL